MNLKRWFKENYKILIFCMIYTIIIIIITIFADFIYVCILTGIVIICNVICYIILEYQIRKNNKEEKEVK